MDDLIKWLRAALDLDAYLADETMVEMGCSPSQWYGGDKIPGTEQHLIMSKWTRADGEVRHDPVAVAGSHSAASTIALLGNPASTLARVNAHRALVDAFEEIHNNPARRDDAALNMTWHLMRNVIATIVVAYADRPDYLPEWGLPALKRRGADNGHKTPAD